MEVVIVATQDKASTYKAVGRDLVDVASSSTRSSNRRHTKVQLVLRAEKKNMKVLVQHVPSKFRGESGGKARVKIDFSSLSLLASMQRGWENTIVSKLG